MSASPDTVSMAMFCDFENLALGVRDAQYDKFDIKLILERLLLKGSIVLKKAYCDWDRYKAYKAPMHEANFELIEIPHVRQSGKNSADIRMVVDALDLCYTKSHVNTFVIVSGDSDFSPLVSKLRENAKYVIGVGIKQSTSDLLIANCDEFIFYDDLVRETARNAVRRDPKSAPAQTKRSPEEMEQRKAEAIELCIATLEALIDERGDSGKIWASTLKNAIKRRKPDFNESYYGFRSFGNLLDEAQTRGLLDVGRDEKSGSFVMRPNANLSVNAPTTDNTETTETAETPETTQALATTETLLTTEQLANDAPSVADPDAPNSAKTAKETQKPASKNRRARGARKNAAQQGDNKNPNKDTNKDANKVKKQAPDAESLTPAAPEKAAREKKSARTKPEAALSPSLSTQMDDKKPSAAKKPARSRKAQAVKLTDETA